MSTTRLTFLYPHLFRSIRASQPTVNTAHQHCALPKSPASQQRKTFATQHKRAQRFVQRHGKAVQPLLQEGDVAEGLKVFVPEEEGKGAGTSKELKNLQQSRAKEEQNDQPRPSPNAPLSEETQAAARLPGDYSRDNEVPAGDRAKPEAEKEVETSPSAARQHTAANTSGPFATLETVLQMPPPETLEEENASKPPHLQTPPYVHHFDTYTLVQQVEAGGFTGAQSITAMKAVRGLLALNLDVAKAGLVSKSDVENETYLFRAACSELRTEIQNNRKANEERMRRERTHLQHEVDILSQKMTQELMSLKDDLKGMFDDRKMDVRMEQRTMERAIQELNYKITVSLNSDSKSEVESLRWILTRRSVMGILFMAFMVLTSLRYASYKTHEDEVKKKKEEAAAQPGADKEKALEELPPQTTVEILAAN